MLWSAFSERMATSISRVLSKRLNDYFGYFLTLVRSISMRINLVSFPPFKIGQDDYADIKRANVPTDDSAEPVEILKQSIAHNVGIYVWGAYQVLVVLVMLNLLISLMTTTFAKIQQNADMEWKFTRASCWIHYFDDRNAIPIPLNLIPSVYSVKKLIVWIYRFFSKSANEERRSWKSAKRLV